MWIPTSILMLLCKLFNFEKKWLHKVELLEAHSQTVYTSGIYTPYCLLARPSASQGVGRCAPAAFLSVVLRPPGGAPHSKANNSNSMCLNKYIRFAISRYVSLYLSHRHMFHDRFTWKHWWWEKTIMKRCVMIVYAWNTNYEGKHSWKRSWNQICIAKRSWDSVTW